LLVKKEKTEGAAQAVPKPKKPQVVQMHCSQFLDTQPTCDLLITDPPYSTDVEDIESFAQSWLPRAISKVRSTGRAFVCIGSYPQELHAYTGVQTILPLDDVMIWTYNNTIGPKPNYRFKRNYQAILYYKGPDAPPLNTDLLEELKLSFTMNAPDGRQGNHYHAWQKPDEMAELFIRLATQPGDLVLDPFCGTGTFLLAASRLGRTALGCDSSPEMLDIARRRGCEIFTAQQGLDVRHQIYS
jgi:DNA modification methylase